MIVDSIDEYEALEPWDYSCQSLQLKWDTGACAPDKIILDYLGHGGKLMRITCRGLVFLQMPYQLPDHQIEDVSPLGITHVQGAKTLDAMGREEQFEKVRFRMIGIEMEGDISFYCAGFTVELFNNQADESS